VELLSVFMPLSAAGFVRAIFFRNPSHAQACNGLLENTSTAANTALYVWWAQLSVAGRFDGQPLHPPASNTNNPTNITKNHSQCILSPVQGDTDCTVLHSVPS
jgi:hypothetical protein